jgi:hypothetical protein
MVFSNEVSARVIWSITLTVKNKELPGEVALCVGKGSLGDTDGDS